VVNVDLMWATVGFLLLDAGAGQLLDEQRNALGMPDDRGAPIVGELVAAREVVDQAVGGRSVER
jgi:hypothetical protein